MNLFFDLDSSQLVTGPGTRSPLNALNLKRGDNMIVRVQFLQGGQPVELASGATGKLGIKPNGDYDGDYLAAATSWTKTGTGAHTIYSFALDLNTEPLATLLGVGVAPDVERARVMFELEFVSAGIRTSSQTIFASIFNDVNRGDEGTPSSLPGPLEYLTEQGLIPINAATDTAKLALTDLTAGQVVIITDEGNRVERYMGGTITDQANWAVLRNTVQLSVAITSGSGNNITVNATGVANSSTPTAVGWVDPSSVPMGAQGSVTITLGSITSKTDTQLHSVAASNNTIALTTTIQRHTLPVPVPARGVVTMNITYPSA
jgi:hypothetical protein